MSYIQCVATYNQVILTSDGRVNGFNNEVLQENYKKINRINNGVAIAYAGNKLLCELIVRDLIERLESKSIYKIANVDTIYKIIMDICIENLGEKTDDKVQFIIGGLREGNKLGIKTVSTNNSYKMLDLIPEANQICTANATSDGRGDDTLDQRLKVLFNNRPIEDIPEIYKIMNDTSRYIATIDNTVNGKIFREIIKK